MKITEPFVRLESVSLEYPRQQRRLSNLFNRRNSKNNQHRRYRAALDSIDLDLRPDDRLAVVGFNGAGKSTLLRILAGVYQPSSGSVKIAGSVGALLDAGFGLDSHLSGLSNANTYSRFYGVPRSDRQAFVADVRDFSGLGDFFDAPLSTYSTGMLTRLMFALVTTIRPDILIMDELISTTDASFIKASRKRMGEQLDHAAIIVLASHSPDLLLKTCNRAILLNQGRVELSGSVSEVLRAYSGPPSEK